MTGLRSSSATSGRSSASRASRWRPWRSRTSPPPGLPALGLYEGYPLTSRGSSYAALPPDKITIYRSQLESFYGDNPERLRSEVRRVVMHEIADHFGISDERLRELDRY